MRKHTKRVYHLKRDQKYTLHLLFDEEKNKLIDTLTNKPDGKGLPHAKGMVNLLKELPDECKKQVLSYYNFATEVAYAKEFAIFIEELNQLKKQQKLDDRFGWRQPFLQNTFFRKKVKDLSSFLIREGQVKKRWCMVEDEDAEGEEVYKEVLKDNFSNMLINFENEEDLLYTPPEDFDPTDPSLTEEEKRDLAQGKEAPFDLYLYPDIQKYAEKLS